MGTPPAMSSMKRPRMGRSTVTWYSFSWWLRALRILFTMSPSLVRKIKPSLGLSRRPTGKMRRSCPIASMMLSRSRLLSVVQTMPTGLW